MACVRSKYKQIHTQCLLVTQIQTSESCRMQAHQKLNLVYIYNKYTKCGNIVRKPWIWCLFQAVVERNLSHSVTRPGSHSFFGRIFFVRFTRHWCSVLLTKKGLERKVKNKSNLIVSSLRSTIVVLFLDERDSPSIGMASTLK